MGNCLVSRVPYRIQNNELDGPLLVKMRTIELVIIWARGREIDLYH